MMSGLRQPLVGSGSTGLGLFGAVPAVGAGSAARVSNAGARVASIFSAVGGFWPGVSTIAAGAAGWGLGSCASPPRLAASHTHKPPIVPVNTNLLATVLVLNIKHLRRAASSSQIAATTILQGDAGWLKKSMIGTC
jgi:hypothetical protein